MPRHQYECRKGHWSTFTTRYVDEIQPELIACEECSRDAEWRPSAPYKMLLTREINRKHNQPDEWDSQTNPKLKPERHLGPG